MHRQTFTSQMFSDHLLLARRWGWQSAKGGGDRQEVNTQERPEIILHSSTFQGGHQTGRGDKQCLWGRLSAQTSGGASLRG